MGLSEMAAKKRSGTTITYTHGPLDEPIVAIGGNYKIMEEKRMPFQSRELFYLIGFACLDTTCCGNGGFGYALVKGFVREWKRRVSVEQLPISTFDPIRDPGQQARIAKIIRAEEIVQHVEFA